MTLTELTDEGQRLMETIFPEHEKAIDEVFVGLNASKLQFMIASLKKIGYQAQEI